MGGKRALTVTTVLLAAAACSSSKHSADPLPTISTEASPAPTTSPAGTPGPAAADVATLYDSTHGMVIVPDCPVSTGKCPIHSYVTTDGGAHWAKGAQIPRLRGYDDGLVMLSPADAIAYALPQVPSITHDGGQTWNVLDLPVDVGTADAVNDTVWFASNHCNTHQSCSPTIASVDLHGQITQLGKVPTSGQPITGLVRRSASSAYALTGLLQGGQHAVMVTQDGGKTWATKSSPCAKDDVSIGAASDQPTLVQALCVTQPGAGNQPKRFFVSGNGATTWAKRPDPETGGYSSVLRTMTYGSSWRFGNGRADLFHSSDTGRTWTDTLQGRVGESAGGGAATLATYGAQVAWVFAFTDGHLTLWRTADAGATWRDSKPQL